MRARGRIRLPLLPAILSLIALAALALPALGCSSFASTGSAGTPRAAGASPASPAGPSVSPSPSTPQPASVAGHAYPDRPITLVISWSAGGTLDAAARTIYPFMEPELGQPLQVVYKPGASGQVGLTEFLHNARPDGYMLAAYLSPTIEAGYLDPERQAVYTLASFAPIAAQVVDPNVYIVRADSPFRDMAELIRAARDEDRPVVSGVGGLMGDDHMSLMRLQKLLGVEFCVSHFDGGAPTIAALYGGHIEFMVGNIGDAMGGYRAGELRVLGLAAEERSPMMPDVPTLREQGIDLTSAVVRGWVAPTGTPEEVLDTLERAMRRADAIPSYRERMAELGQPVGFMGRMEYARHLESEEARVAALLQYPR